jgi:hypothetical protein
MSGSKKFARGESVASCLDEELSKDKHHSFYHDLKEAYEKSGTTELGFDKPIDLNLFSEKIQQEGCIRLWCLPVPPWLADPQTRNALQKRWDEFLLEQFQFSVVAVQQAEAFDENVHGVNDLTENHKLWVGFVEDSQGACCHEKHKDNVSNFYKDGVFSSLLAKTSTKFQTMIENKMPGLHQKLLTTPTKFQTMIVRPYQVDIPAKLLGSETLGQCDLNCRVLGMVGIWTGEIDQIQDRWHPNLEARLPAHRAQWCLTASQRAELPVEGKISDAPELSRICGLPETSEFRTRTPDEQCLRAHPLQPRSAVERFSSSSKMHKGKGGALRHAATAPTVASPPTTVSNTGPCASKVSDQPVKALPMTLIGQPTTMLGVRLWGLPVSESVEGEIVENVRWEIDHGMRVFALEFPSSSMSQSVWIDNHSILKKRLQKGSILWVSLLGGADVAEQNIHKFYSIEKERNNDKQLVIKRKIIRLCTLKVNDKLVQEDLHFYLLGELNPDPKQDLKTLVFTASGRTSFYALTETSKSIQVVKMKLKNMIQAKKKKGGEAKDDEETEKKATPPKMLAGSDSVDLRALNVSHIKLAQRMHMPSTESAGVRTVRTLMKEAIIPLTGDCDPQCSYVEFVRTHLSSQQNVGRATAMLSYSWDYVVQDIIDVLEAHCKDKGVDFDKEYVWMCCFCINQHEIQDKKFPEWRKEFADRVVGTKNVLAMIDSWTNMTYMTRAWCDFEFFMAVEHDNVNLSIVMPERETARLAQGLAKDTAGACKQIQSISKARIENATAFSNDDLDHIKTLITEHYKNTEGEDTPFQKFDQKIAEALKDWLIIALNQYCRSLLEDNRDTVTEEEEHRAFVVNTVVGTTTVMHSMFKNTPGVLEDADGIVTLLNDRIGEPRGLADVAHKARVLREKGVIARRMLDVSKDNGKWMDHWSKAWAAYETAADLLKDYKLMESEYYSLALLTNMGNLWVEAVDKELDVKNNKVDVEELIRDYGAEKELDAEVIPGQPLDKRVTKWTMLLLTDCYLKHAERLSLDRNMAFVWLLLSRANLMLSQIKIIDEHLVEKRRHKEEPDNELERTEEEIAKWEEKKAALLTNSLCLYTETQHLLEDENQIMSFPYGKYCRGMSDMYDLTGQTSVCDSWWKRYEDTFKKLGFKPDKRSHKHCRNGASTDKESTDKSGTEHQQTADKESADKYESGTEHQQTAD